MCVIVYVSCARPMRFLCLWLMMIKCLVALLCENGFHEKRREIDRERGGREANQSYVWLERERERENERESARDDRMCVRVQVLRWFLTFCSLSFSLALSQERACFAGWQRDTVSSCMMQQKTQE